MTTPSLQLAIEQIDAARRYSSQLISSVRDEDWFRMPPGGVSHIAWQAGHLAAAEYLLTAVRMRGKQREDDEVISKTFIRCFNKGSTPQGDAAAYPPVEEIRETLARVHQLAMSELPNYSDEELSASVPEPHIVYANKLGSLLFCASHEMLHAGQIGLLRRQLGYEPVR